MTHGTSVIIIITIIVMIVIVNIMFRSFFDSSFAQVTATLVLHLFVFHLQIEMVSLMSGAALTDQFFGKLEQIGADDTDHHERAELYKELLAEYGDVVPEGAKEDIEEVIRQASNPSLEQITAVAEGMLPAKCKVEAVSPAAFKAMSLQQQIAVKLVQLRSVAPGS